MKNNNIITKKSLAFLESYIKLKQEEWDTYTQHFTEWERTNALDV